MTNPFSYDVFLSYSSKDKAVVRAVAERLRADGLKVWLDEWVLKPGDSIPAKIEEGLEHSRVLVLCMSANAFGSDWAQLEAGTFRFRDPLNRERRFIPLRLDDAPIKGSLAQFLYINWLPAGRGQEYAKLLEACRPLAKLTAAEAEAAGEQGAEKVIQLDYNKRISAYAFSPDGKRALTGNDDKTVRLWDVESGQCLRVFEGHTDTVWSLGWSSDQNLALSGSFDKTVRLWDVATARCLRVLRGHTGGVTCVVWSPDHCKALSGSSDKTLRLWDVESGRCLRVIEGHTGEVECLSWNVDQRHAFSGAHDKTLRLWDLETGQCLRVFSGHTERFYTVSWSTDNRLVLSSSADNTIRLWEVETGRCLRVLEGHKLAPLVAWHADQRYAFSGSWDNTMRLWDVETGRCLRVLQGHGHKADVRSVAWSADGRRAFSGDSAGGIRVWNLLEFVTEARTPEAPASALPPAPDQVEYTNAKVLLVGESGVGKTGLSNYLAHGIKVEDDKPLPSTDGAWATHWPLRHTKTKAGVEREIWLWDFAGQVDYRLVHQLFMDDTAAAVIVFNPQNENPFEGLGHWDRDLQKGGAETLRQTACCRAY